MTNLFDSLALKRWFLKQRRQLPWRHNPTPYQVWVSEVMLQQTQVATVIPYYERWMARFPTLHDVAVAAEEEIVKMWEGLGYYSRARNLWHGARLVVDRWNGSIPSTAEELSQIKGLGPYTIGAILSFAFKKKSAAVDGNVMRVLARYFRIQDDISKPSTVSLMRSLAAEILPEEQPWLVTEGLIELGATVCSKVPMCQRCPLQSRCQAFLKQTTHLLPFKSKKVKVKKIHRLVAILAYGNSFVIRQCCSGEIMQGLYEFPYFTFAEPCRQTPDEIEALVADTFHCRCRFHNFLSLVTHTFTHHKAFLYPVLLTIDSPPPQAEWRCLTTSQCCQKPFSAGHKKILAGLMDSDPYP